LVMPACFRQPMSASDKGTGTVFFFINDPSFLP
jgi:hypothetical protein